MAITTDILVALWEGGYAIEDAVGVCQAMERGPDRDAILALHDSLGPDADPKEAATALIDAAAKIIAGDWQHRNRAVPNPYKQRLGISPKAWRKLRAAVFERDGEQCSYCGSVENMTVDHVIPLNRGGTNDMENLTPACRSCNSSKRDRPLEEWGAAA